MRYVTFGKLGWQVSAVGFGSWGLGGQWGPVDRRVAMDTVDAAFDAGINLIDTADAYGVVPGTSEEILGKALVGRRHQVYVTTKVGNFARRAGYPLDLRVAAARLPVLRRQPAPAPNRLHRRLLLPHQRAVAFPRGLHRGAGALCDQGKIRAYGISTDNPEVLSRYVRQPRCAACQLAYSLLDRRAEDGVLPICRENNLGTLIRSPLRSGLLTGKYSAESRFSDIVRDRWNEAQREEYTRLMAQLDALRPLANARPDARSGGARRAADPARRAYSHPGAKSPEQLRDNASAADVSSVRGRPQDRVPLAARSTQS